MVRYAVIAIVLVLILAIGGYFVAGFAYSQSKLNSAGDTYKTVIDHQNGQTDFFNSLDTKISAIDPSNPTQATIQQAQTAIQQLVTKAQTDEPQVESDDAALARAEAGLKQNQWLTAPERSTLDKRITKIEDLRSAPTAAKELLTDYQQYGSFVLALLDCATDITTLDSAASKHDLVALTAAVTKLKADATKGIGLDHAPGLAPEVDGFMHDLSKVADDFSALIAAAAAGNQAEITKAENALNTDGNKLGSYDFNAWDTTANQFFNDLKDLYNRNMDKANND